MSRFSERRLLITGHRGFIGQHLWRELSNQGYELAGVDIVGDNPVDLRRPGVIEHVLDHIPGLEGVIHLAAQVGRIFGERDLRHTIAANTELTTVLAKACGERGLPVLYASTSEVYGDQGNHVCHEADPCLLPHNLYGLSKRWGEEALRLYAPSGLQVVRLSMPYGPGAPPGAGRRALDNILWQAHHGKPIPIHEGAARSWCWVEDTCRAIRMVLEQGEAGYVMGAPGHGVYNVGRDDAELTMHELAIMACALADACEHLIELVPAPAAQTVVKRLSTSKLSLLGWEPEIELHEGLPMVLDWVKRFDADGVLIEEHD